MNKTIRATSFDYNDYFDAFPIVTWALHSLLGKSIIPQKKRTILYLFDFYLIIFINILVKFSPVDSRHD